MLVSDDIRDHGLGRINADGRLTVRGSKPPASPRLFQRFNSLDQCRAADPHACLSWPTLRFGTLLGGEMEAVGIHLAAIRHRVDWLIV